MNESVKIRVAGTKAQVELLTEQLRDWSKTWGKKKIFRVKRYDRKTGSSTGDPWKYHQSFGARRFVNYITMKLPKDPRHPVCMIHGHSGDQYCGRCGAKMPEDPQKKCAHPWHNSDVPPETQCPECGEKYDDQNLCNLFQSAMCDEYLCEGDVRRCQK